MFNDEKFEKKIENELEKNFLIEQYLSEKFFTRKHIKHIVTLDAIYIGFIDEFVMHFPKSFFGKLQELKKQKIKNMKIKNFGKKTIIKINFVFPHLKIDGEIFGSRAWNERTEEEILAEKNIILRKNIQRFIKNQKTKKHQFFSESDLQKMEEDLQSFSS